MEPKKEKEKRNMSFEIFGLIWAAAPRPPLITYNTTKLS